MLLAAWANSCAPDKPHPQYAPSAEERAIGALADAESAGRVDEAVAGFTALCEGNPPSARACYETGRALFAAGRIEEGRAASERFVRAYPESGLAPVAAERLANSFGGAERDAAAARLDALAAAVAGSDVHDTVLYETADLERRAGRTEDEARRLAELVDRYTRWSSQLWDNALWRLCAIKGEQGDIQGEKALVERLLATRERSRALASYASPYHDDALLRLGELRLAEGDTEGALDAFLELARMERSAQADDALYALARIRARAGDSKEACALLERIRREMPRASVGRKAEAFGAEIGCPRSP